MNVAHEGVLPTASFDGILCGFGRCDRSRERLRSSTLSVTGSCIQHGLSELR